MITSKVSLIRNFEKIYIFIIGFLYTFRGQFYLTSKISLFTLLIITYFIYKVVFVNKVKFRTVEILFYILLIFYPLVPNFIALNKFGSFEIADYVRLIEGVLIFIAFSYKEFAKVEYNYLFAGMLTSTIFSILMNYKQIIEYFTTGRFSLFVNPLYEEINYASSYYVLILAFCIMIILSNKQKNIRKNIKYTIYSVLIILAILMSVSRSGFIGLSLLMITAIAVYSKNSNFVKKAIFVLLISFVFFQLSGEFKGIYEVISSRFSNITHPYGGKIDPRFIVWYETIKVNLLNPFGIGLNNIRYYTIYGIPEHNTILQAWSAYGVILIALVISIFKQLKRFISTFSPKRNIDLMLIMLIISYVPFIMTLNLLTSRHFWIIVAIIYSRNKLLNSKLAG